MVSILKTDKIQASHGTNIEIPSGHVLQAPGHILQVKQTVLPHASTFSSTTTSMVTTGHEVSITPSSTSNKILLNFCKMIF